MASTTNITMEDLENDHFDQENLSTPPPPSASSPTLQPLAPVSNILQSPIVFNGKIAH